jgi:hypothetical protein
MITELKGLFYQYYNQFITWYDAADDLTQVGVLVASGVAILFMLGFIFLSKISK